MARKKIDDQMAAQWIHLHKKGESYRSIGREFGVNYRTVKSWIQRAGEEKEKEHWEAVSQQIDAKYLDEHYRMLLKIAAAVLDVAHSDPIVTNPELAIPVFFDMGIRSAMQKTAKVLVERGLELTYEGEIEVHEADRLGRRLLDALMEHEPLLKTATEAWESDWTKFQKTRLELMEVAKNLFKNAKVDDAVAEGISIIIVDEVLRNKILGEEPCSSRVNASDRDDEQTRDKRTRDKLVQLTRYNKRGEMTVYTGSMQEVEATSKTYEKVLLQLSHEERVYPVKDIYHSLMKRVEEVEDYVDRLILMGRPQGQCPLCLNQSTRLL